MRLVLSEFWDLSELETLARSRFSEEVVARGQGRETVALLWRAGVGVSGWVELENTSLWPETRFTVEGLEIRRAISRLIGEWGSGVSIVALWHSHQRSRVASMVDEREFPGWMVGFGAIFVVSTGETVYYDSSGDITMDELTQDKMEVGVDG